jgi:hypothetical protein
MPKKIISSQSKVAMKDVHLTIPLSAYNFIKMQAAKEYAAFCEKVHAASPLPFVIPKMTVNDSIRGYIFDGLKQCAEYDDGWTIKQECNKDVFIKFIDMAIEKKARFLDVFVSMPGMDSPEIISNPLENMEAKKEYYNRAYDENMRLKTCPDIQIINARIRL